MKKLKRIGKSYIGWGTTFNLTTAENMLNGNEVILVAPTRSALQAAFRRLTTEKELFDPKLCKRVVVNKA